MMVNTDIIMPWAIDTAIRNALLLTRLRLYYQPEGALTSSALRQSDVETAMHSSSTL